MIFLLFFQPNRSYYLWDLGDGEDHVGGGEESHSYKGNLMSRGASFNLKQLLWLLSGNLYLFFRKQNSAETLTRAAKMIDEIFDVIPRSMLFFLH